MTDAPTRHRPWSVTDVRYHLTCPKQARFARSRMRIRDFSVPVGIRRGRVLHTALGAAYKTAQVEATERPTAYQGRWRTMRAFRSEASEAFSAAWRSQVMPDDAGLANEALGALLDLLDRLPRPKVGTIHEVERKRTFAVADDLEFTVVPDLVLRDGPRLLVRDWKSGTVDDRDPSADDQLNLYAAALAAETDVTEIHLQFYPLARGRAVSAIANPDIVAATLRRVERVAREAETTELPARPSAEHCGSCRFRLICADSMAPGFVA